MRRFSLVLVCLALGCGPRTARDPIAATDDAITHARDLASHMPPHLVISMAMSWFGIPARDPLGGGVDVGYGNWIVSASCGQAAPDPSLCGGTPSERRISSRYRPLAGIYSSAGGTAESLRRIDLMLSTVRRPCDQGARIDAFGIQLNGTHFTSLHGGSEANQEIPLQSLEHFLSEADAASMTNAVLPAEDATWYWNNAGRFIDCATHHSTCIGYLQADVEDMIAIVRTHPSALRIDGRPVLLFYVNTASGFPTASEWASIFQSARSATGADFYTIATGLLQSTGATFFSAFDGVSPWVSPNVWSATHGSTIYAHAKAYAASLHQGLIANVPAGGVVFGGVAPGFDDWTEQWGACKQRQIPPASEGTPRDLAVLDGTIDYLAGTNVRGMILETWDDWTEGSFFEPSVSEGTSKLVELRRKLADLYGEPQDSAQDAALDRRWTSFGQPRSCAGARPSPAVDLTCTGGGVDGGVGTAGVSISSPTVGQSTGASVSIAASASTTNGLPITAMLAYLNANPTPVCRSSGPALLCTIAVPLGNDVVEVNAWDSAGHVYTSANVPFTSAACAAGVTIRSPSSGASVGSSVEVAADAVSCNGKPIVAMKAYLDGNPSAVCSVSSASLDCTVGVPLGTNEVEVNAWDASGAVYTSANIAFTR
jgi:hypothetical protein